MRRVILNLRRGIGLEEKNKLWEWYKMNIAKKDAEAMRMGCKIENYEAFRQWKNERINDAIINSIWLIFIGIIYGFIIFAGVYL